MYQHIPKGAQRVLKAAISDPRLRGRIRTQVNTWMACSGPEWTVGRLKAIRSGLYQLRAGNPDLARAVWQKESIAYNKGNLLPKGPFGIIGSEFLRASKPSVLRRLDAILRIYTCIFAHSLTRKQLLKAKDAINGPYSGEPRLLEISSFKEYCARFFQRNVLPKLGQYFQGEVPIDLGSLSPISATHAESRLIYAGLMSAEDPSLKDAPWFKHIKSLWTSVYLPEELKLRNPAEDMRAELEVSGADSEVRGHISFIQEGGCKARVVAVPNVWIQMLFKPLEDYLDKIIRHLTQSCSHNQNRGAYFLQSALRDGKTVFCYDLSSATDRFPRKIQQAVLEAFGLHDYSDALERICEGPWRACYSLDGVAHDEVWSYAVGQPMGMYSSFKLFHLTHILLIGYMCRFCKVDPDCFAVLGDDVIITNQQVARTYHSFMEQVGVDISDTKSVISNSLGEFAGFVSYTTNKSVCTHRPFKYTGKSGFGAAIPLLFALGSRCRGLSPWFADKYEMFIHTISMRNPDLSPLISEDDLDSIAGGLNTHLLGALSNRLARYLKVDPTLDLLRGWEGQQIILLGQKEIVSGGFASASLNTGAAPGTNLEPYKENARLARLARRPYFQLAADPLMRDQLELRQELENNPKG